MALMTVQQMQTLAQASIQGAMVVALAAEVSKFVSTGLALSAGMSASKVQSAQEEYEELNKRIFKLGFVLERYRSSVVSLRENRQRLMKEHGLTVTPSLVELRRKYPQLYATERNLKTADEQLGRVELRDMLLKKRRKELAKVLGITVEEEIPKHIQYTRMKKFVPKTGMY